VPAQEEAVPTGDVHILFQVVEEDGVRLGHARLPSP